MFTQQTAASIRAQLGDAWDGKYPITIKRERFDRMNGNERRSFVLDGGKVVDPDPPKLAPADLPEGMISRSAFDKMSAEDRAAHIRGGGRVIDAGEQQ